ncbi:sulfotransferase [Balneolaceae bacterium YR4-1]|uniref:Sulfotransferase n=1 Tax=Halalkalibaculum roseum TaxID=2709311 RepID=A0A6M1ST33_9BACT|nr:sulfotransferase domain-containing protein [Halalkalibaculum roseum]NGP78189.1 sulfotransferase [Halalkalibaculum roseum]
MNDQGNSLFLITGMLRSGTTLVEKLLDAHISVRAIYQPFPKLYRHLKQQFFSQLGYKDIYYVLNDLFNNTCYNRQQFIDFLDSYEISSKDFERVLQSMEDFGGQYTSVKESKYLIKKMDSKNLINFYSSFLTEICKEDSIKAVGTKEIIIEEFVEYYLNNSIKVILILRDPRDVFTSINVGKGTNYAGEHRPALFHLRNWRKSVAVANTFKNHKDFLMIRYEDLLLRTNKVLKEITDSLKVNEFPKGFFKEGIPGDERKNWKGNSSTKTHRGINSKNLENFKKYLTDNTINYIEYICKPEMLSLNYKLFSNASNPENFTEPFQVSEMDKLNPKMSTNPEELLKESYRLELLKGKSASEEELRQNFYSLENFKVLSVQDL